MPAASFIEALRTASGRLAALWRLKLQLSAALFAAFGIPYFVLQRWPVLTPGRFGLTALDVWIGFQPGWIWVYQSVYGLISLPPLLATKREELALYARGFLLMTAVAIGFYILMPIEAPRPADVPRGGMWGLLLMYDRTINTFPSLHVAMATHSLCFAAWLAGGRRGWLVRGARGGGVVWLVLVIYSTLATKQHYAVDLPAGVLLGILCQWLAVRMRAPLARSTLGGKTA
jgi:membrane-associated phospholipid phosphatase